MAADIVYEKISLWRTAWAEMKASKDVWFPWVAGFIVFYTAVSLFGQLAAPVTELDKAALKQHPEMLVKYFKPLIPMFLMILCLYAGASYTFATVYLRQVVKNNPPELNVKEFFFWLGQVFLKYLRPLPWLLLTPLLGFGVIMYYRSAFRRFIVTPLAILRREPVLQRSWDLTEGNIWRIIWGSIVLNVFIIFLLVLVMLIPIIAWAFAVHGDKHSFLYTGGNAFFRALSTGISLMANAIYSCTVYRVLLREKKAATPASLNDPTSL